MKTRIEEIMEQQGVTAGEALAIVQKEDADERAAREKPAREALLRKRDEDQAARKKGEDDKLAAAQARHEEVLKDEARAAWLESGGKAADFDGQWDTLRAEVIKTKTLAKLSQSDQRRSLSLS